MKTAVYFEGLVRRHFDAAKFSEGDVWVKIGEAVSGIAKEAYFEGCKDERKTKRDLISRLIGAAQHAEYPQGDPPVCSEASAYLSFIDEMDKETPKIKLPDFRAEDIHVESSRDVERERTIIAVTHVPTGIVATCSNFESVHKNKAEALRRLRVKVETQWAGETPKKEPNPCLDPDKMHGAGDQFPGSDYPPFPGRKR